MRRKKKKKKAMTVLGIKEETHQSSRQNPRRGSTYYKPEDVMGRNVALKEGKLFIGKVIGVTAHHDHPDRTMYFRVAFEGADAGDYHISKLPEMESLYDYEKNMVWQRSLREKERTSYTDLPDEIGDIAVEEEEEEEEEEEITWWEYKFSDEIGGILLYDSQQHPAIVSPPLL